MSVTRDWKGMRDMSARLPKERTGGTVDACNQRIMKERSSDEKSLRTWLTRRGVTAYTQSLLVMERFSYPDFRLTPADNLTDAQYTDPSNLRPIFDALVAAPAGLGEVVIQTRMT